MTTSFGADPLKDSNQKVTVGTTAADLQQILGSLYSAGLIAGGIITRSATALTYTVSNGVAAFPLVADNTTPYKPQNQRTVVGGWAQATVTTTAPSSGTRTDIVYAQQLTPTDDGDASVVVRIGTTLPARAVLLGSFLITAGNTNTMASVPASNVIKYSIPYGASLGRIVNMTNMFNSAFAVAATGTQPRSSLGTQSFNVPTDRLCKVSLTVAVSALGASGFDNTKYCEAGYEVYIDNIKRFTWSTAGLHQAWMEYGFEGYIEALAGAHTIRVDHYRAQGPGTPVGRTASPDQPYARIIVEDIGPIP